MRNVISALQTILPSTLISASVTAKPDPSCMIFAGTASACPGVTKVRSFDLLKRGEERHAGELGEADDEPAGGLRHRLHQQHAGHQRVAREMTLEDRGAGRDGRLDADLAAIEVEVDDAVDELEILKAHAVR